MPHFSAPKLILTSFAAAAFLSGCGGKSDSRKQAEADMQPDAVFERFKPSFIDSLWYYNPEWASGAGFHKYDSLLVVPNAGRRQVDSAFQVRAHKQLLSIEAGKLSVNNQTDYRLIENYLNGARWYADTLRDWQWNPANYNLASSVAEILNGRYQPLDRRLRSISFKIWRAADYYEAAKTNIKQPTKEHTELAILQNQGGLNVFGKPLLDSVARSGLSEREKQQLRDRISTTRQAITAYVAFLKEEVLTAGKFRSFRLGKALFDQKFSYDIQASYTADEVYQKAQQHRQELLHDMGKRAARLWPKYFAGQPMPTDSLALIKQVVGKLSEKHATQAGFVAAVKQQIPVLVKFVNDHQLLTQDPSKPLVVRETPLYMRGSGAGASVSAPGPYDKAANTYYNVEPLDGQPATQAQSYLREYNDYTLQILNIHEAIPGHYTQLVYANRSPSLIKSIFGNGAMIEGWAVYAERMMLESGYGGNTDEIWLMWDKWNMRVTLNAILDHEVHAGTITEAQTLALLQRDGFQEESEARNKWRRATLSQVQLSSYFTGYTAIYDLREELKKREGKAFSLKAFNEQFLSYGSAPVKYIRGMMLKK
ncbi:DUF885 domain-containing protein [Hymenobacter crusticola]|uniref:DUF885 domain-containing protein n=1 Tax=Hymenobacter crusticola TaxID=1770526 RepID=A0A243WGU4_9BACT|nr:DUF885 domain-containing protein [Hymenobacter crusticola]OUJ74950.1 hypothetical protein BXP70_06530 [Hymenobacter crusticola]